MRVWRSRLIGLLVAVAVLTGVFIAVGPDRVWSLFGPADLGPVAFETLERRTTPNDALACPTDVCQAKSDLASPVFAVSAHDLRSAFRQAISSEPRLSLVQSDDAGLTDRYVQRSRLMGYPDTIVVRFFERPGGHSTIALYSRSQLGKGDMGVNLARLQRWLNALEAIVPPSA
jgi:uncharacterized protein (DUF1499 family)